MVPERASGGWVWIQFERRITLKLRPARRAGPTSERTLSAPSSLRPNRPLSHECHYAPMGRAGRRDWLRGSRSGGARDSERPPSMGDLGGERRRLVTDWLVDGAVHRGS